MKKKLNKKKSKRVTSGVIDTVRDHHKQVSIELEDNSVISNNHINISMHAHNQFALSGELNIANVMSIYEKIYMHLQSQPQCHLKFDFSKLTCTDSAGLAFVIEWIKYAKKNKKTIEFFHFPQRLMLMAKAAGLADLICTAAVIRGSEG